MRLSQVFADILFLLLLMLNVAVSTHQELDRVLSLTDGKNKRALEEEIRRLMKDLRQAP